MQEGKIFDVVMGINKESLDDSLTSIQWLCQLESNELLETKTKEKCEPEMSRNIHHPPESVNPFPKPQYSYATLIVLAINSTADKRMTLQSIYAWIEGNFPYFKYAKKGWKNSIRHNLSLHKFFIKEQRGDVLCGKGSYWRISPEGKENMMRDILKPPSNNLQPPIALLPHDPNRKLRHILPKPCSGGGAKLQFVPMVDYNLPVVFLPNTGEAVNQGVGDTIYTAHAQMPGDSNFFTPFEAGLMCTVAESSNVQSTVIRSESASVSTPEEFECRRSVPQESLPECQAFKKDSSEVPATKAPLCTPTKIEGTHRTPSRKPKDISPKRPRSQVSKNSKRLPNILRRRRPPVVKSAETPESIIQTPLKSNVQSTLAAINSGNHTPYSPKRRMDGLVNMSSTRQSSPVGHNHSLDFFQHGFSSPGISPLRSPICFNSGLTPLRQSDIDSGIVSTPMKSYLGDLSFNWTPLNTGFTPKSNYSSPVRANCNTQRCRKSLGLEQINE